MPQLLHARINVDYDNILGLTRYVAVAPRNLSTSVRYMDFEL